MHVSTNPKSKEPLKLTTTELSRLTQAQQVAMAVAGGALMLGDMELREVADKMRAATATLLMYLSGKRPKREPKGESDGCEKSNIGVEPNEESSGEECGVIEARPVPGEHRQGVGRRSRGAVDGNIGTTGSVLSDEPLKQLFDEQGKPK